MTTIVVDAKMGLMAADRQVTSNDGDIIIPCETKIERVEIGGDQYLVGLAGLEGSGAYFMDWLIHGDWDEPPEPIYDIYPEDDFSALMLCDEGIFVADKFCRLSKIDYRWYAVGTGGPLAWAVLEAGCGVDKAMQVAIKMDPSSGCGYQIRHLHDSDYDRDSE